MTGRTARAWNPAALAAVAAASALLPSEVKAQCAMCGAAAASSGGVARGIALSIFFLLGTLLVVVAWLVVLVLRTGRRARVAPPRASPGSARVRRPRRPA